MITATHVPHGPYRLVVDLGHDLVESNPVGFYNVRAALTAAPRLNTARALGNKRVYTHVARFDSNDECEIVAPVRSPS